MRSPETQVPPKERQGFNPEIEPYKIWRLKQGTEKNDRPTYCEYVITQMIKATGTEARKTTDEEDAPGGGDILVNLGGENGSYFMDTKTSSGLELGRHWTSKNTVDIHIDSLTLKKLESGHIETQAKVLDLLGQTAQEFVSGDNVKLLEEYDHPNY